MFLAKYICSSELDRDIPSLLQENFESLRETLFFAKCHRNIWQNKNSDKDLICRRLFMSGQ